jgi:hypothetical protein
LKDLGYTHIEGIEQMKIPNVLIVTESPFSHQNGFGFALHSLFSNWEASFLFQICCSGDYSSVQPTKGVSAGLAWLDGINSGGTKNRLKSIFGLSAGWNGHYSKVWLQRTLRMWRPNMVYSLAFSAEAIQYAYWAASLYKIPFVAHVTDHLPINSDRQSLHALMNAQNVLCATIDLANLLTTSTGRECIYFPPIGCSLPTTDILDQLGRASQDNLLIVYLGTVHSPTLYDTNYWSLKNICDAVTSLSGDGIKCRLEIYGSAANPSYAKSLADGDCIFYCGAPSKDEGQQLMQNADCLLVPLSFNLQALEAMKYCYSSKLPDSLASGTPTMVYAPPEAAISKICKENNIGFLVTNQSLQAIKAMLKDLACNRESAFARAAIHAQYAIAHMSSESLSIRLRNLLVSGCIENSSNRN